MDDAAADYIAEMPNGMGALNERMGIRLVEASDRLRPTDLKVVEHPFSLPKFEAGKIYFLNTQKLGKNSLLVRGFEGGDDLLARPDAQAFTIWDTIRNTIEDPDIPDVMFGMGNKTAVVDRRWWD